MRSGAGFALAPLPFHIDGVAIAPLSYKCGVACEPLPVAGNRGVAMATSEWEQYVQQLSLATLFAPSSVSARFFIVRMPAAVQPPVLCGLRGVLR